MGKASIYVSVGNILEDFTSDQKYCNHLVSVNFNAKQKCYGCKLEILAVNCKTDKIIFHSLIKIRSRDELPTLKLLLQGMDKAIEMYSKIAIPDDSE